jgi:hypothetical protein
MNSPVGLSRRDFARCLKEAGTYGARVSTPIYISTKEVDLVVDGVRTLMSHKTRSGRSLRTEKSWSRQRWAGSSKT